MIENVEVLNPVNLTPHNFRIVADDGFIIEIPASGEVARCATEEEKVKTVYLRGFEGHPVTVARTKFGAPSGVPEAQDNNLYLTSTLVKEALKRDDVAAPGKGVRNESGQVYAAQGLACV